MSTVVKSQRPVFVRTITNLAFWVVLGIVLGVIVGFAWPELGIASKPGIDWFIKILKWMIGPIIFLTIVSGIIGLESLKEVGSIGFKGFVYFEVVSTLALAVGISAAYLLQPGVGMNLDVNALDPASVAKYVKDPKEVGSALAILKSAIPTDPITPFIKANTLQVLFMAIVTAIVLSFMPNNYKKTCMKPLEFAQHYVLKILAWFMWFSPIAAYSAMAYLIGKFGLSSLIGMIQLLAVMAVACIIFIFVVLGIICYVAKVNIFKFMRFIAKEVLVVFATSSSETALGPLMKKLEAAGISRGCVGLIIPTGYSFNLDCTNIYLSMSIIFLAQAFNIDLSFTHLLSILIILMITSKGAVGVTGSGFIVLAGTLGALHDVIPVVTVAVLLGVDKFMSEMRAVGNLCGNSVACLIVAIWDKKIDMEKFRYALDHPDEFSFN
ncbi:TPA: cation:dicarboxylase symporter family transporter [Campylobacter fetus subsp. venerealis]|uniref:C4-dicarboxylate transport protein n=1 Tax=Campylobacter fetus subsp. venerealis NCTC 10354 TaxID=983328 RepID=A0AAE6IXV8_CAMFE|nr:cation:dicarboxylase symporter family transporter [Campylobacter fetus]OCS23122.1 C4-dicarboxylate ABC transporter [Campylobacter fetus subsp. venerealis cfvi97/532]OCS27317.1 C4-dicarboxylate ABC transporter [Campylobacter fetus subsp. venerealis cfvB10]OCS30422.1 C4-dicarboxylate ABC transporter [Campylobacter fetus subsp. venerealis LMG 6570 = CCUG 33900]OCS43245.1 C4-dicarboxylate ABC transporter [Campylobacter fetus subsp. venerealis cfvi02/298]AHE93768.1 C4-dicarboxylate transport pro